MIGLFATLAAWAATPDPLAARAAGLRAEHIVGLEAYIAARPSQAGTAALWHRLGEARADQAWVAHRAWYQVYSVAFDDCFSRNTTCSDVAPDPEPYRQLTQDASLALALVGVIDPGYPRGAEALETLAWTLELDYPGDALAADARALLVEAFPESTPAVQARLLLADRAMAEERPDAALDLLDAALASPAADPASTAYARYQRAWALYKLDREVEATDELLALCRWLDAAPGLSARGQGVLRGEVQNELVYLLILTDRAEMAPATALTLAADAEERDLLLARLARRLLQNGFEAEAEETEAIRASLGAPW